MHRIETWFSTNWADTPGPTAFHPYALLSQVSNNTVSPYLPWSTALQYTDTRQGTEPCFINNRYVDFTLNNIRYFKFSSWNQGQYSYLSEIAVVSTACPAGAYIFGSYSGTSGCLGTALSCTALHSTVLHAVHAHAFYSDIFLLLYKCSMRHWSISSDSRQDHMY